MVMVQTERKPAMEQNLKETRRYFIGVAWPYVNGDLHLGHLAGYLLPADVCARYYRATGKPVLMVSGSDCFGTPITVEADKKKVAPKEIADTYHEKDVQLLTKTLGLSYDIYTRTDTEHHIQVVQEVFLKLLDQGYIFIDTTQQYYSPEENRFLPDRYVEGGCNTCGNKDARSDQCDQCGRLFEQGELENPRSKLSGQPVILKDTQHYFLDWTKLQPAIEKYVVSSGGTWKKWVHQETLGWLRKGLKPRAITRDLDWGVPLPLDRISKDKIIENAEHKRLYVWFDAVIGYFSASQLWAKQTSNQWQDYWQGEGLRHYYFMGKDNLIFHTLFWPGQLMIYDPGLHLPDVPSINMFLSLEGQQFSKSRGVTITIEDFVQTFGNDPTRFYMTMIMPETRDSSFKWDDFREKNNKELVGNLGNFIHRILSISRGVDMGKVSRVELSIETSHRIATAFSLARRYIEGCEFKSYLDIILALSGYGNKLVDQLKLWQLKKENLPQFEKAAKEFYSLIIALGYLLLPLLPETSGKIFNQLGLEAQMNWPGETRETAQIEQLVGQIDSSINPTPLFRRVEKIDIDNFLKV